MFRMPSANPSYFNPGIYGGSQGSFGMPYRGRSLPGDIGFSKQPSYPNLGYNPGMSNWFANPSMRVQPQPDFNDFFQNRGGNIPPQQIPSPYGPGGYPPMEPKIPGQQSGIMGYQPTVSS
jgi:hypothetical protein